MNIPWSNLYNLYSSFYQSRSDIQSNNGKFRSSSIAQEEESVMSEDTSSERPVETLKKMLFTVQRLTHSSEENSDHGESDHSLETQSETLTEGKQYTSTHFILTPYFINLNKIQTLETFEISFQVVQSQIIPGYFRTLYLHWTMHHV